MSEPKGVASLRPSQVDQFQSRFDGELLRPGDAKYEDARSIWNGMIRKTPGLIARCANENDVASAVRFARDNDLLTAVRSGGHSMPGLSMCDGGLVIDLSALKAIKIDPIARRASVGAGATLGEYDLAAQGFGLATPAGAISHTGVAGLTLGGGIGWLQRAFGLTIDSLLSVDVVTAEGDTIRADADENAELFWGIRGGGGNFGIVTQFRFRLHPVGPQVLAGPIVYPLKDAAAMLSFWRDWAETTPAGLTSIAAVFTCPPEPQFPQELHNKHVCAVIVCWAGAHRDGEDVLAPLRAFGSPAVDLIHPMPFIELQSSQDEKFAWGRRYYNKNAFLDRLDDEVIEACVESVESVTSPLSAVAILHMGGAVQRVAPDATAFVNRGATYNLDMTSIWTRPEEDDQHVDWVRRFHAAVQPHAIAGEYVNTTSMGGQRDVRLAYGRSYDRLVALKDQYDPTNLFRLNQNIEPSS